MTMPTHSPDQQPWGAPGMQPPVQPRNGLGTSALVLGIVGLLFAIIPFLFWLGGILGLLALIFGIVGASRAGKGLATNKGMAVTGLVLGALSILVSIIWTVVIATAVKDVADEIEKSGGLPTATSSAKPGAGSTAEPSADATPGALKFGETFAYEDGLKVTVSKPRAHKPDAFAAGYTKGNKAFQVTITIVNGGKEAVDVTAALPNASDANGAAAEMVFDGSNATKPFEGKVLPGKQAKADFTFAMAPDAAGELQVEIAPTVLDHESAVWTGSTK
ncbi:MULTISPECIES: DUF4190 domain-containing protein [unclassified Streptomyces]|uniref:DUF4190 domain-containing protein n=1 Tax=unclassified Streptomyces TaxID=2593676 RepID=UPI002E2F1BE3|nr:DUF4190 domain-containing protein [Streptomyces sp. NBC_01268]